MEDAPSHSGSSRPMTFFFVFFLITDHPQFEDTSTVVNRRERERRALPKEVRMRSMRRGEKGPHAPFFFYHKSSGLHIINI